MLRVTGLYVVLLSSLLCSPASAADRQAWTEIPVDAEPLPAVDGLNAKVSGFGGAFESQSLYGGEGSLSVPLGHQFGLQVDGLVAGFDSRFQGDVSVAASAGHLFWRDSLVGLFGLYGHYLHADAFNGVDLYAGAAEGALYLGRLSLDGVAGVQGGDVDLGKLGGLGLDIDIDARFFDVAFLSYYPTDNLKLSAGHSYLRGNNAALFGAEWGVGTSGGTMAALYASGAVTEHGDAGVLGGLRVYLGQRNKTLIRRHREDDPTQIGDSISNLISQINSMINNSAHNQGF